MLNEQELKKLEYKLLNELRSTENLSPHNFKTRKIDGTELADNPGIGKITIDHESNGITYCNINGGDSGAYYYYTDNPKVMYNFKGEPNFIIRQFDRNFADKAEKHARRTKAAKKRHEKNAAYQDFIKSSQQYLTDSTQTIVYFAFRDAKTDKYHVGSFDRNTEDLNIDPISSKDRISDYFIQHGLDELEIIETFEYVFKPESLTVFDPKNKFVNKFVSTVYLKNAKVIPDSDIPASIERVVHHVFNSDQSLVEHFLNWAACIIQYRCRTETAWILQGTTGTGKGLLIGLLRKIIGEDYVRTVTIPNLEDNFNGYMDQCLILFIDEVDTDQIKSMPKLISRLKTLITEPKIALRAMRTDLYEVPNHLNIIMASNQPNSMRIEDNDRRFNVSARQDTKLLMPNESGTDLVSRINDELQDFTNYLMSRPADRSLARITIENESKLLLQKTTQTSTEEISQALLNGDLEYFVQNRPCITPKQNLKNSIFDVDEIDLLEEYQYILNQAISSAQEKRCHFLNHKDLFVLFELLNGNMPPTKIKLSKRLSHLRINLSVQNVAGESKRGLSISWTASPENIEAWGKLFDIGDIMPILDFDHEI